METINKSEIGPRGEQVYETALRRLVETEENIGKLIAIDIDSGDYEIGTDVLITNKILKERHPGAWTWTKRIGYNAVFSVGGTIRRTTF